MIGAIIGDIIGSRWEFNPTSPNFTLTNQNINMKRIFSIFVSTICLTICFTANAQNTDKVYLAPNPQSARWSYIETDKDGKHITTVYNSIESIEGDGVNGKLKMRVEEVGVASPKDTVRSYNFYCFKDGEFMADMYSGFEDNIFEGQLDSVVRNTINEKYADLPGEKKKEVIEQIKSEFIKKSGEMRGIPRNPKVGQLPNYEFTCKINIISMKVLGEDRRIVGKESIQTKAGLFDCFILEETITIKSMMLKDVEKIKAWYAYGIGLVKEVSYDKNGKLVSTMILNEINW